MYNRSESLPTQGIEFVCGHYASICAADSTTELTRKIGLPQAKKKSSTAVPQGSQIAHRLSESFFILTILVAVYVVACLVTYNPADPGPFNSVASHEVGNIGRVLGAWLANFFLFLTGYLA
jgi:hypothetical protein